MQIIYIFIATYFLSFGVLFFAQSVFIFKKLDSRFYFSLASLTGTVFIFCSALLSTNESFSQVILIQKIKVFSLYLTVLFWIVSIHKLYFQKSILPKFFTVYTLILGVPILFGQNSFSYPINEIAYTFLGQSYSFHYATPHPFIVVSLIPLCVVLLITANKLYKLDSVNISKTIKTLLLGSMVLSFLTAFHDMLVVNGYITSQPLFLELVLVLFFIATFSIYFEEQKKRVERLKNINQELDRKVREKTEEIDSISQQLWVALQEQKHAFDLKSEMLQIAAHDMKSPLQGIIGYSELLMAQYSENKPLVERLGKILKSADDMLHLIQEMLEHEIKSVTEDEMQISDINFSELVVYILDKNHSKAIKKNQNLISEIDSQCRIEGDSKKVMEIIDNLIDNAIKYSRLGGDIFVFVRDKGDNVVFEVKDSGPGLSVNDKQLLFKKFQRLSAKPTGGENSTGIGLYIVNKFVQMHGGRIEVESEPGSGTVFKVFLPKRQVSV
jgi:signal transduction histidine kinase